MTRRTWLLAGAAIPLSRAWAASIAPVLGAGFDGDNLYPVAPELHFLSGKVLERLRDTADTQTFLSQVTLLVGSDVPLRRVAARFVVSYSIWEEKFKVSILAPVNMSKEGMSQRDAERWTLDNLSGNLAISTVGLAPDQPFKLKFEMRAPQSRDLLKSFNGGHGLSLSEAMIEYFSRKASASDSPISLESTWLRLRDLPRMFGRAARMG